MGNRYFGGNSGYVGYSMSKRAMYARNEGAYPKSDFKKEYEITASHFNFLEDADIIYVSEWHHTSKFGNRTDFYRWSEDEYIDIYQSNKKEISKLIRSLGKTPKMKDFLVKNTMEEMNRYTESFDEYIQNKKNIINQIQDIFF